MTLNARLARLETKAGTAAGAAKPWQILIYEGRKTSEPYDHHAPGHMLFPHNHRDRVDLKVWGDPAYAIDWDADHDTREVQIARQRAHLGIASE